MNAPAFQFYASDFLANTADMTAEEAGAYVRLLCQQWIKGGLPNDDARLSLMAGQCQASAVARAKAEFQECSDGLLKNSGLETVRAKQAEYREKQAKNGAKRWVGNAKPHAEAMPSHEPKTCSSVFSLQSPVSDLLTPSLIPSDSCGSYHRDSRTIIRLLNEISGKKFRETDANLSVISQRLREHGVDLVGVTQMINRQFKVWQNTTQFEFYRPETLFGKTKFDGYYAARELPLSENNKKVAQHCARP